MPGRDGSGPAGQGSRTGRGMGNCSPGGVKKDQSSTIAATGTPLRSGRGWGNFFGLLFGHRRRNRTNRI